MGTVLMTFTSSAAEIPPDKAGTLGPSAPGTESKEVHDKRIQWWRGVRFGMFQSSLTPYNVADSTPFLTIPAASPVRFVSTYRIDLQPVSSDTPHPEYS